MQFICLMGCWLVGGFALGVVLGPALKRLVWSQK